MTQHQEISALIAGKADDERIEVSVAFLRALVGANDAEDKRAEELLSTQQVANALGVSRPFVVKLIDEGALPAHRVGAHRRVRTGDLETYRYKRRQQARAAMDELVALTEEMGLYEHQR